ncbi:MAG TPA: methylated-DNA--[protein]-cysteine S-methyltransferase [Rhizobiales bacterium]|nr:methylated-DNA--[protein]-cysteine S-methyltransferase [Hyphomicrobiales bacterium]
MNQFQDSARDYARISRAIAYLVERRKDQPSLNEVARHMGLSPSHFQRLFTRWAGVSPKVFVQSLTIEYARGMLQRAENVLETSLQSGLSGPSRLHDLFLSLEAMTPGEYRAGGAGLEISYGFHPSPFGLALTMVTAHGLAGLGFADGKADQEQVLADMCARWPNAHYRHEPDRGAAYVRRLFDPAQWSADSPIKLVLIGGEFDVSVWSVLPDIPPGCAVTYSDIAIRLGRPGAARAVGSAVGRNPISFALPCHRVLRKDGALGGYHWGLGRKRALIGWESGLVRKDLQLA